MQDFARVSAFEGSKFMAGIDEALYPGTTLQATVKLTAENVL